VGLKQKEVELMLFTEETRVMMTDLSLMDPVAKAWFEKKKNMIHY
jgi:hypothetical protein